MLTPLSFCHHIVLVSSSLLDNFFLAPWLASLLLKQWMFQGFRDSGLSSGPLPYTNSLQVTSPSCIAWKTIYRHWLIFLGQTFIQVPVSWTTLLNTPNWLSIKHFKFPMSLMEHSLSLSLSHFNMFLSIHHHLSKWYPYIFSYSSQNLGVIFDSPFPGPPSPI